MYDVLITLNCSILLELRQKIGEIYMKKNQNFM